MPFPDSPRVIYNKNPLTEVICQLTFPAILKIDSEIPAKFQERIRMEYPIFSDTQTSGVKLDLPPELGGTKYFHSARATYEFISDDKNWKIVLTRDFLAIITTKYKKWEDFKNHLNNPLQSFIEEYQPAFFSRIGLRYKDIIQKSELNFDNDVNWNELLKPAIAGELTDNEISADIQGRVSQIVIRLGNDKSNVVVNHGLVNNQLNQECYLIDSDFSTTEKTEVSDVISKLDSFNRNAGRLFRWCISDKLHNALEPISVSESVS